MPAHTELPTHILSTILRSFLYPLVFCISICNPFTRVLPYSLQPPAILTLTLSILPRHSLDTLSTLSRHFEFLHIQHKLSKPRHEISSDSISTRSYNTIQPAPPCPEETQSSFIVSRQRLLYTQIHTSIYCSSVSPSSRRKILPSCPCHLKSSKSWVTLSWSNY